MVAQLGDPLRLDVFERRPTHDGEGNQEHVRLRVGQRTQAIVILLTGGIPQTQVHRLAVNLWLQTAISDACRQHGMARTASYHDVGRVVVEHGGDVLAGKGIRSVGN